MDGERSGGLLAWQWSVYAKGHRDRRNLLVHALTQPLFIGGTLALAGGVMSPFVALGGVVAMAVALIAQGRGHKLEQQGPAPFTGPLDAPARLFVEQWVTFPRYVMSGGFARAWREASATKAEA